MLIVTIIIECSLQYYIDSFSHRGIPSHLTTPPRDLVQITLDPIIQDDIIKFVSDPTAGAITLFIGGCSL